MILTIDEKQFIRNLKLVNLGNRCFFSGMVFFSYVITTFVDLVLYFTREIYCSENVVNKKIEDLHSEKNQEVL